MSELRALLFDVDGTLADTERDGHRVAFNRAFREAGLDWEWTPELYGELLAVTGGKERMLYYLERFRPDFARPADLAGFVAGLHQYALRGAFQRVALTAVAEGRNDLEADAARRACRLALGRYESRTATARQQVGELGGDALRGFAFGVQRGIGAYGDAATQAGLHRGRGGNQHQAAGTQLRTRCFSGRRGISGECGQCRQQGEQAAQQHCAAHPGAGRLDHRNDSLERCDERYT